MYILHASKTKWSSFTLISAHIDSNLWEFEHVALEKIVSYRNFKAIVISKTTCPKVIARFRNEWDYRTVDVFFEFPLTTISNSNFKLIHKGTESLQRSTELFLNYDCRNDFFIGPNSSVITYDHLRFGPSVLHHSSIPAVDLSDDKYSRLFDEKYSRNNVVFRREYLRP